MRERTGAAAGDSLWRDCPVGLAAAPVLFAHAVTVAENRTSATLLFSCGRDRVSFNFLYWQGCSQTSQRRGEAASSSRECTNMLGSYNVFATMTCVNSYSYVTVTYFCTICFCAHLPRVRDAARLFCFSPVRSWSTNSKSTARYLSF
jgi:hypothetical protein